MEVILIILIVVGVAFAALGSGKPEKRNFRKERAQRYLNIVRENTYQKKRVCNKLERAAYLAALSITLGRRQKERVLVEVNLGEILYHPQGHVHEAINGKRVDVLITTENFDPLVVFEIDGSGHHLSDTSHENDEIKNLALASAGIAIFRIDARHDNPELVKKAVRAHLMQFFGETDSPDSQANG